MSFRGNLWTDSVKKSTHPGAVAPWPGAAAAPGQHPADAQLHWLRGAEMRGRHTASKQAPPWGQSFGGEGGPCGKKVWNKCVLV